MRGKGDRPLVALTEVLDDWRGGEVGECAHEVAIKGASSSSLTCCALGCIVGFFL